MDGPVATTSARSDTRFSDIIYEKIVSMISDGRFPINERLPSEQNLATLFGASRPVVREALERLRNDDLIVSRKGSGSYVRQRPDSSILQQVPVGSSQEQVLLVLGTPSTVATLSGEAFYYISQRGEKPIAFMSQKVVDQRVIAIYFDKNRQVQRLANYGLQDGKIFDFISRTTATSGQEMSYLAPLFKLLSFN